MARARYVTATWRRRPGQRSDDVRVRWPWQHLWFSTLLPEPRLKVTITPQGNQFWGGIVSLEILEYDPKEGLNFWEEDAWQETDTEEVSGRWPPGEERRFTLRIPSTELPGEGVYQSRIHMEEREKADEHGFAILSESYYYAPEPIRVHGAGTTVTLIAGVAGLLGALLGALVTALLC